VPVNMYEAGQARIQPSAVCEVFGYLKQIMRVRNLYNE